MTDSIQTRIDQAFLKMQSATTRKARRLALKEMETLIAERSRDPDRVARMEVERGLRPLLELPRRGVR